MRKLLLFAVWCIAMGASVYGVAFADVSKNVRIECGIACGILYAIMIIAPYLHDKRKQTPEK